MRRIILIAICSLIALPFLLPSEASAFAGATKCETDKVLDSYSANYYRVAKQFTRRTPGRNIRKYGLKANRPSKCSHLNRSIRTFKRWLAPPVAPVAFSDAMPTASRTAPTNTGGRWAIPADIVMCESGGNYNARNPSGAYGAYQIMPGTAAAYGCSLATPAGQDACAAKIYAAQGRSPWVCG